MWTNFAEKYSIRAILLVYIGLVLLCASFALSLVSARTASVMILNTELEAAENYLLTVDATFEVALSSIQAPIRRFERGRLMEALKEPGTVLSLMATRDRLYDEAKSILHAYNGIYRYRH